MCALLRDPGRVPGLFSAGSGGVDWASKPRPVPSATRLGRFRALFDRDLADETVVQHTEARARGSRFIAAASVMLLLYAVPFLGLADTMLDAAMPP